MPNFYIQTNKYQNGFSVFVFHVLNTTRNYVKNFVSYS